MSLNDYKDYIDILCNIVVNGGIKTDKDYIAVLSIIEPFLDVDEEGALKVTADRYKTDDTQKIL